MKFSNYLSQISKAVRYEDGHTLSSLLESTGTHNRDIDRVLSGLVDADAYNLPSQTATLQSSLPPWGNLCLEHALCLLSIQNSHWKEAYGHQEKTVSAFFKYFQTATAWCLPVLYVLLKDLRVLAELADAETQGNEGESANMPCSEDCARMVNKAFTVCATDRTNQPAHSRRLGVYKVAALSMKCYFKVDRPSLCKNLIRATASDASIPPLDSGTFPMADRVTWRYFVGLLGFLNGDEASAEENLSWAFDNCHANAYRNQEIILTYLIPIRMLRGTFPSSFLLSRFPRLSKLYTPFLSAISSGSLQAYDSALESQQKDLVDVGTWMVVERAREICLRSLFKATWMACDKGTRVQVENFQVAMKLQGVEVDLDEVECMIANMIYKGYMKGYISHEKRTVVLAKSGPFPSLKSRARAGGG